MEISVNYWAVLVAGVAYMVIGALWYGPLFGKLWMRLAGVTPGNMKNGMTAPKAMAIGFISALVMAQVLAHEQFVWSQFFGDSMGLCAFALQLAFWLWLGFIATTQLGSVLWEGRSWKQFFLETTASFVSLFAMALILTYWV